jgi:hypothetical protein
MGIKNFFSNIFHPEHDNTSDAGDGYNQSKKKKPVTSHAAPAPAKVSPSQPAFFQLSGT